MKTYIICLDKTEEQAMMDACSSLGISYDILETPNNVVEFKVLVEDEIALFFLGCRFNENLTNDIILEL